MTVRRFKGMGRCSWIRDSLADGEGQLRNRWPVCAEPPTNPEPKGIFSFTAQYGCAPNFTRFNVPQYFGHANTPQCRGDTPLHLFSMSRIQPPVSRYHPFGLNRLVLSGLVSVSLSACMAPALHHPTSPNPFVPPAWSTPTAGSAAVDSTASLARWWSRFNDPLLSELVLQALHHNTGIRTAKAALQQSRAVRDAKVAGILPRVGASVSGQSSRTDSNDRTDSFHAGFDASWEPDVFGGQRSGINAADADEQVARTGLGQVQVSLAAEVAVTYIELRSLQVRLAIARGNLAAQMETLQLARWRAQAGLASSLDVEQALAASEQTSAQLPALTTSLAQTLSSLSVLTGLAQMELQSRVAADGARLGLVPQAPPAMAVAIPAQTLRQRPDVHAAEFRITAALARVAQADAARYPSFQISGSLGLRALTLGALTNGATLAQALLAGISIPLFDGGAARAQVRAQEAALEQARVAYEAVVLGALKDVEDALVSLQGNTERLARLMAASQAAFNADLLARQRYASGLIDFRAVLETQRTLLSTQDNVASTRANLSADHVRLYKALGGGWIPEAEAPTP